MKKYFISLKKLFVNWLLKETLTELKKDIAKRLIERDDRLCILENHMRMVKSVTNISVDLHRNLHEYERNRSWVAVNIRGDKQDWVQYFEGDDETIKQLQRLFRGMEKDRIIVDRPPHMKRRDFWFE